MILELIDKYSEEIAVIFFAYVAWRLFKGFTYGNKEHFKFLRERYGDDYDRLLTEKYGPEWREQLFEKNTHWGIKVDQYGILEPKANGPRADEIRASVDAIKNSGVRIMAVGFEKWLVEPEKGPTILDDFEALQRYVKTYGICLENQTSTITDEDQPNK